jgi:hypothetical protein
VRDPDDPDHVREGIVTIVSGISGCLLKKNRLHEADVILLGRSDSEVVTI